MKIYFESIDKRPIFIKKYYEKWTGDRHEIVIYFTNRDCYEIYVDGQFYSTAENRMSAFEEIDDIVETSGWEDFRLK